MAGIPTQEDWQDIDNEMLESDGGTKQESNCPKTPKPRYDFSESDETPMTDGGVTTQSPDDFYELRLEQRKSALDGDTPFSDSSNKFLPDGTNLDQHSRVSDLVRSQIESYQVNDAYVLGVTPEDIADADNLTEKQAEQLLENDIETEYEGSFDYAQETKHGTLYIKDTTIERSEN